MIVTCKDLIKIYKDSVRKINVPALRGCDFEVNQGELVSIVGPSGSGKTTLINILAGLDTPSSGEVEVAGYKLDKLNPKFLQAFRLLTIGLVDQFPERTLFLNVTIDDNLTYAESVINKPNSSENLSNQTILEQLGILKLKNRCVNTLSGGEITRVALACALAKGVPLILCDEPTGQLDGLNTDKIKFLLKMIVRDFGTTIIVVTHDKRFLDGVDRTFEIKDGRVTAILTHAERVLLQQSPKFPLRFKSYIDTTRTMHVPDMIYKTLKLTDSGEFLLKKKWKSSV